jgi:hypothetical protein
MRLRSSRVLAAVVVAIAAMLIGAGAAEAVVTAVIGPKAKLLEGGAAVSDTLTVRCDAGLEVIDATLSVQQGATDGTAHLTGVACDGKAHRYKVTVPVRSGSGLFHPGEALAVAVVYAQDPQTGGSQRAEVGATIQVR